MKYRFLTQNLLHGGGSRISRFLERIQKLTPDTIVLTEFRNSQSGANLKAALSAYGWQHQIASPTSAKTNGVLIASRFGITAEKPVCTQHDWDTKRRLSVQIEGMKVVAVYLHADIQKLKAWELLLDDAQLDVAKDAVFIGDFNTGKHRVDETATTFIGAEYPSHLEALGYIDTWRSRNPEKREYTWYSNHGNGFRLDYAYASPSLSKCLIDVWHDHGARTEGVSDHSGLVVDFDRG